MSVSNIHRLWKFTAIDYTFEKRIKRNRSLTGRNDRKRSHMNMRLWKRFSGAAGRNGNIIPLFENGIVKRMVDQVW